MDQLAIAPPREIELFEPPPNALCTIEATAQIVDVPRRAVLLYYKLGLVSPAVNPVRGYFFDRDGIRRLRQIETLRPLCCDPLASIKIILNLMDQVGRLSGQDFSRWQTANGKSQGGSSTTEKKT